MNRGRACLYIEVRATQPKGVSAAAQGLHGKLERRRRGHASPSARGAIADTPLGTRFAGYNGRCF